MLEHLRRYGRSVHSKKHNSILASARSDRLILTQSTDALQPLLLGDHLVQEPGVLAPHVSAVSIPACSWDVTAMLDRRSQDPDAAHTPERRTNALRVPNMRGLASIADGGEAERAQQGSRRRSCRPNAMGSYIDKQNN